MAALTLQQLVNYVEDIPPLSAATVQVMRMIFVGGTERIFNARELGLECSISFFYRRID